MLKCFVFYVKANTVFDGQGLGLYKTMKLSERAGELKV